MPEFRKKSPKHSFSITEKERFGHVFAKTGPINSGTGAGEQTSCQSEQLFATGVKGLMTFPLIILRLCPEAAVLKKLSLAGLTKLS